MSEGYLLDTCALMFIAEDFISDQEFKIKIGSAALAGKLFVSPISAWEIGRLSAFGRFSLSREPLNFFNAFLAETRSKLCNLEPEVLIASSFLPSWRHKDPMDRLLVATARHNDLTLVTRDQTILEYGTKGHVKTLAC